MAPFRFGPVFLYESASAARRWQTYAARAAYLFVLFTSLTVVQAVKLGGDPDALRISKLAEVGESFFYAIVGTQLALVLLAAPAYTAGAICLDRARGTLAHMLVTDLSATEIVLGKLGARLLPVLSLVIAGLPILALAILLGGIDPGALLGGFLVALGVAIAGCSLALALSVWGNKPHEVLLGTYVIWAIVLLAWPAWHLLPARWAVGPAPAWLEESNPFWLTFAPYLRSGGVPFEHYLVFLGACLAVSALLVLLAALTLRRKANQESAPRAPRLNGAQAWHPPRVGPSLDFNPVLWRELHRRRPSRWVRVLWVVYFLVSLAATVVAFLARGPGMGREMMPFVNAFVYSIGLLLVSVTSVTALFEERVRGSLDVLMTTPLSTASIVYGKWWGVFRSAILVTMLPLGSAVLLAAFQLPDSFAFLAGLCVILLPVGMALALAVSLIIGRRKTRAVAPGLALVLVLIFFATFFVGTVLSNPKNLVVLLLTFLMLAYGAAVTSLGLALATWVKRFGMAIGLSVAAYVLVTGGSILVLLAVGPASVDDRGLGFISPWYGAGELTYEIGEHFGGADPVRWKIAWGCVYGVAALVLLIATRLTFDRCMGRMSDNGVGRARYHVRRR